MKSNTEFDTDQKEKENKGNSLARVNHKSWCVQVSNGEYEGETSTKVGGKCNTIQGRKMKEKKRKEKKRKKEKERKGNEKERKGKERKGKERKGKGKVGTEVKMIGGRSCSGIKVLNCSWKAFGCSANKLEHKS
ncbi:hypothetical protein Baya_12826 [Bagarius yarrelli]|uniref:Uncharacterized protein n=1 Tax=Bagarius yarrelli TaxID=175774 RepID=A0A556V475_BAGYA|nr:hypothetical protein Baya_12826 [Bagarius yarrelli]